MNLMKHQKDALIYIKWLIHPTKHLGEGRTTVLACAMIEIASENPGLPVCYRHWVHPTLRKSFATELYRICSDGYRLPCVINSMNETITIGKAKHEVPSV
jgi:hypothetical protein